MSSLTYTKKIFILQGLHCASCANKIENQLNALAEIESATLDFATGKLYVNVLSEESSEINSKIKNIASQIESGVTVTNENEQKDQHDHLHNLDKMKLFQIGTGAILFIAALILPFTHLIDLAILLIAYIIIGGDILLLAIKNILRGQIFDENFLMTVASIGAFAIGEAPEAVAVMLFYQTGEMFQDMAVRHSRRSISDLMDIRPDFAHLKQGSDTVKVSPEQIKAGDIIIIKPGERVPLDGKIINGTSALDTSALTGESVPRDVGLNDEVLSGSINIHGVLTVEVTKIFKESTVSKILDLVENASANKSPTENFITKFARYYTPFVVFSALALAIIPPLVIEGALFSEWLHRALIFLVLSCPCALVISIPLGFFGGIGGASRNGILIKGGNYLDALNKIDTIVFDKTGTLTKGVFKVTKIVPSGTIEEDDLLKYAAYAESYSNHPIASSIIKAFGKDINKDDISEYKEIAGHGIQIAIRGKKVIVGNAKLMENENIIYPDISSDATIIHIAIDDIYAGYIIISDEIKEDSLFTIKALKEKGIKRIIMLTGDSKSAGEKIGYDLGLDEVYSELLPHEKIEKLELIEKQKKSKHNILFAGDGINDAPVLARADIGVAMGGLGSDAAIEAADIVLMTDEPSKLITALNIAKKTRRIVIQNIAFALCIKTLVLILGAQGLATLWEAVFADVGVAILAILNAMRILKVK